MWWRWGFLFARHRACVYRYLSSFRVYGVIFARGSRDVSAANWFRFSSKKEQKETRKHRKITITTSTRKKEREKKRCASFISAHSIRRERLCANKSNNYFSALLSVSRLRSNATVVVSSNWRTKETSLRSFWEEEDNEKG